MCHVKSDGGFRHKMGTCKVVVSSCSQQRAPQACHITVYTVQKWQAYLQHIRMPKERNVNQLVLRVEGVARTDIHLQCVKAYGVGV